MSASASAAQSAHPDEPARRRRRNLRLAEAPRALAEFGTLLPSAGLLLQAPRGDGHPVLVMPGLGGSDNSTAPLRAYLATLGHSSQPWQLGRNLGPLMDGLIQRLGETFDAVYSAGGEQPVSLVGWSLGGVYARLLAHRAPTRVRQVITLGSPFAQRPRASTPASGRATNLHGLDVPALRRLAGEVLPGVPSTAIYSRTDGVVPWQIATQTPATDAENIEVYGSHVGLGFNPAVLFAVADRLGQPASRWRPFQRNRLTGFVYGPARLDDAPAAASNGRPGG